MGYLFVHFTGEHKSGEQVYFSLSKDGLFWNDLNGGEPVLYSDIGEGGVRDPFLVKDEANHKYYLVATDLRIEAGKGWQTAQYAGSRDLIVWESEDLAHWNGPHACTLAIPGAGCLWAPEVIYDEKQEAFLVFFASMVKEDGENTAKQRIYAVYTKDFHDFTPAIKYIERQNHVIDTTIVKDGDCYYRFSKDETTARILMETGKSLTGEFSAIHSDVLEQLEGVEGPECYKLPNGSWCLIVDQFQKGLGYLPLVTEDLASGQFRILEPKEYGFGKTKKRHGGVMKLTDEEYDYLFKQYSIHGLPPVS